MQLNSLTAISPVDGRYGKVTSKLRTIFSEFGLIRSRVIVEVAWLIQLASSNTLDDIPALSEESQNELKRLTEQFNLDDAQRVKAIEETTNHDVKAVEYWLKESVSNHAELSRLAEYFHFACTSEDINNLAYGLMLKQGREELLELLQTASQELRARAHEYAELPVLSRTHGQPATPSTLGKEFANVVFRLDRQIQQLREIEILGKVKIFSQP